jgi:hypothetical protein
MFRQNRQQFNTLILVKNVYYTQLTLCVIIVLKFYSERTIYNKKPSTTSLTPSFY